MARKSDISLRLTTQGKEDLKRALRETGEEGRKMADQLDRAGKKGARGLKAIDETAKEARGGLEGLTQELGPLGAGLRALGPLGLAAGASAGALALGFGAAVRIGKEAVDTFSEIGNSADRMGLAVETAQALSAEFAAQGIEISRLDTGMAALAERQAQIADEQGELYSRLKDTNPELLRQLQGLESNEDRLRAVTKALQEAETQTDRNRIAYAAFGEAGRDILRVLTETEGGIDGLIDKGKELGLVIDEDLIRRSQSLSTEFDIAAKVIDLELKQAFVGLAPILQDLFGLINDMTAALNDFMGAFKDAENRTRRSNLNEIDRYSGLLRGAGVSRSVLDDARAGGQTVSIDDTRFSETDLEIVEWVREFNAAVRSELDRARDDRARDYRTSILGMSSDDLKAELDAIEQEIADHQAAIRETRESGLRDRAGEGGVSDGFIGSLAALVPVQADPELASRRAVIEALIAEDEKRKENLATVDAEREAKERAAAAEKAAKDAAAEADRKAKEEARERLALQREALAILTELGVFTDQLAEKQARLDAMVKEGFLDPDQAEAAMQAYRDEINGVTEAVDRWVDVVKSGRSPVEALQDQQKALTADLDSGKISVDLYTAAYAALKTALKEAKSAQREATEEFKAASDIKRQLAEAAAARRSFDESLAVERARVKDLVKAGELSTGEADAWLDLYTKKLRDVRREVDLWAEAETILDGVQQGRIKTIGDVGRVLAATLIKIVQAAAQAEAAANGGQGIGGFISGVFSRIGGMFGYGGGGAGGSGAGSTSGPAATVPSHSGSVVGTPPRERRPASMRLAGDERVRVVREDQEIVTSADRRKLVDYLSRDQQPSPPPPAGAAQIARLDINLKTRDETGGRASVSSRQNGQGGLDLEVVFRDQVRGMAARGEFDDALEGRGFERNSPR